MKRYIFYFLPVFFILTSCNEEGEKEKVVNTYSDGKPQKVHVFSSDSGTLHPVKEITYYNNGKKRTEGALKDGQREGIWVSYHPNGNKWSEGSFVNGKSEGGFTIWNPDGKVAYKANYKNGKPDGKWTFYDENGKAAKEVLFENGVKVSEKGM